jgi:demethylmenaquinone methyltransferase/2-methoxy-6-polyprenyl-1,4-benzoquinol methylase
MRNFTEIHRVLKPGGRYVVLEFSRPTTALLRVLYHFYLRNVIPVMGGLMTGDRASFVYLNDSIRQFPDQEALASELRCAGFSDVAYRNLTGGIVAIHVARK